MSTRLASEASGDEHPAMTNVKRKLENVRSSAIRVGKLEPDVHAAIDAVLHVATHGPIFAEGVGDRSTFAPVAVAVADAVFQLLERDAKAGKLMFDLVAALTSQLPPNQRGRLRSAAEDAATALFLQAALTGCGHAFYDILHNRERLNISKGHDRKVRDKQLKRVAARMAASRKGVFIAAPERTSTAFLRSLQAMTAASTSTSEVAHSREPEVQKPQVPLVAATQATDAPIFPAEERDPDRRIHHVPIF